MIYLLPTRIWICLSLFYFAGFWSLSRHLSWSDQHPTSWKDGPTCIECWPVLWWIKNHLWHFYVAPECRKWSTTGCHIFSYRSGVRPSRRYCLHSRIQEQGKWYIFSIPHNISWTAERICTIELVLGSVYQFVSNDIWCISKQQVLVEIQAYQCSDIISYLLKLAWQLPSGMSFDHVMAIACAWTITLLYIYLCVWGLDLRLNNINYSCWYFSSSVNHHILILNSWNTTQPQYHNQWVSYLW